MKILHDCHRVLAAAPAVAAVPVPHAGGGGCGRCGAAAGAAIVKDLNRPRETLRPASANRLLVAEGIARTELLSA